MKGSVCLQAKKHSGTPDWSWQGGKGSHIWKATGMHLPLQLLHSRAGPGVCAGGVQDDSAPVAPEVHCTPREIPRYVGGRVCVCIPFLWPRLFIFNQTVNHAVISLLLPPGMGPTSGDTCENVQTSLVFLPMFWSYNKMLV